MQRDFQSGVLLFISLIYSLDTSSKNSFVMKNNILLVLVFFLIPIIINGQTQEATTLYGKKVILNADGTWKYAEEATTTDGKKVILSADGTWKYSEKIRITADSLTNSQNGSINSKVRGVGSGLGDSGTGTSNKGISYNLQGRGIQVLPKPKYDYQGGGRVVVEVSVDREGKVVQAISGTNRSTTLDEYLLNVAKEAALKARFEVKQDAPVLQKGTITYNFILK
jgi:hypothetical protein